MKLARRECSLAECFEALRSQDIEVVCPSNHLARRLQLLFAEAQKLAGIASWPAAAISSEFAWIYERVRLASMQSECWSGRGFSLIAPVQSTLLWQRAIASGSQTEPELVDISLLIETVKRSYVAMKRLGLAVEEAAARANSEQSEFLSWCKHYEALCSDAGWYDPAQIPDYFCAANQLGLVEHPQQLWLLGFEELDVGSLRWLTAISETVSSLEQVTLTSQLPAEKKAICFEHWDEEIAAISIWASEALRHDPSQQVFVAVPARQEVIQALQDGIQLHFQLQHEPIVDAVAVTNDTRPIIDEGAIQQALAWVALMFRRLEFYEVGFCLRQNHSAEDTSEFSARAKFELELRNQQIFPLGYEALVDACERFDKKNTALTGIGRQLAAIQPFRIHYDGRESLERWGQRFTQLLLAVGWLPEDDAVHSLRHHWSQAIDTLAQLNTGLNAHSVADAYQLLKKVLSEMADEKQVYSKLQRPIQILSYEEAAAFPKAKMWIASAVNELWPIIEKADPLLSASLQYERRSAGLDPQQTLEGNRTLAKQLLNSAEQIVLSASAQRLGQEQTLCQLLFKDLEVAEASGEKLTPVEPLPVVALEKWRDEPVEKGISTGLETRLTARALELQALCPFRAFVETRLGGSRREYASRSISRRQQGIYLHRSLEHLWGALKSQAELKEVVKAGRLDEVIERALNKALPLDSSASQQLRKLERRRLAQAIKDWLEVELERETFRIDSLEKKLDINVLDNIINVRIDRIDQSTSGPVLLDYKSSEQSANDLLTERLVAPQLALYALAVEQTPVAISYATINTGVQKFSGIAAQESVLPKVKSLQKMPAAKKLDLDWQGLSLRWRQQIEVLATEWCERNAEILPIKNEDTCRYCHLRNVCRRDELQSHD